MSSAETLPEESKTESRLLDSQGEKSLAAYFSDWFERIRAGDLGILPTLLGLFMIAIIFQSLNNLFITPYNIVNLLPQMAGLTAIAFGAVFVLLLGEIDLSVGYVSGVSAAIMVILSIPKSGVEIPAFLVNIENIPLLYDAGIYLFNAYVAGFPWYIALAAGLLTGILIGLLHGTIITSFQLPAFVVTLAGFLFWNGVLLIILGNGGTVRIQDAVLRSFTRSYVPPTLSYVITLIVITIWALIQFRKRYVRQKKGLSTDPRAILFLQLGLIVIIAIGIVYYLNLDRGIPVVAVFVLFLFAILTYIVDSTRYGRYLMAVGGNKEAARRAGIPVELIRTSVFMISGLMAAIGGIILSLRLGSASTSFDAGSLLLNAIAAAVIGGTSLFGGRGFVYSALLGALIIQGVDNGMGLLGLSSGVKFIVTGLVLLSAVVLDSFSRRRQQQSGIA